ncbi:hypothetical protein [Kitasatospora sp. NPDC050463]|uniref:hypothetical protein n=1 Tax=Kitasatospora sp. NPDC050463 TaxID=3155786 RepID=UPI0033EEC4AA
MLRQHFGNEQELLDLMAETMTAEARPPDREPVPEEWPPGPAENARARRGRPGRAPRAAGLRRDGTWAQVGTVPTTGEPSAVMGVFRGAREKASGPGDPLA